MKLNNFGFSLVSTTIGAAIAVISLAALSQLMNNAKLSESFIGQTQSAIALRLVLIEILSDRSTCDRNFGGTSPAPFNIATSAPQPNTIFDSAGTTALLTVGNTFENNGILISSLSLGNYVARSTVGQDRFRGTMDLTVVMDKTRKSLGSSQIRKVVKVSVELLGFSNEVPNDQIKTCIAVGLGRNNLWTRTAAGHIVIPDTTTNVAIGMNSPSSRLQVNGDVIADRYYGPSDRRLKENIETVEGLSAIRQLRGISYTNIKNGKFANGLLAQDVEKIFPEAVLTDRQSGMKAVDYEQIIAPLIEATKQLAIDNEKLKTFHRYNQEQIKEIKKRFGSELK